MADDLITIRLKLTGGTAAAAEAKAVSAQIAGTGTAATKAGRLSSLASRGVARFSSGLAVLGRTAKRGAVAGLAALGYETWRSVNAFRESHKISRQSRAAIKSSGGAAKVSAKEIGALSEAISLKTGADDEAVQSAANMLLTFHNIRNQAGKNNDVFDQTTVAVTDMAAAMGKDAKSQAILLGKALNDPIAGMSALSRVGVQFDQETKDRITSLVEQNRLQRAQKIILGEITSEFGGSARAQNDYFDRAGVAWENLEEKAGGFLYRTFGPGIRAGTKNITTLTNNLKMSGGLKNTLADVSRDFKSFVEEITDPTLSSRERLSLIGKKLEDGFVMAINWITDTGLPTLASHVGQAAPKVAAAFGRSFMKADALGKIAIGYWLTSKLVGGKLLSKVASAGGTVAMWFGRKFVERVTLFLIGTGVADSLLGMWAKGGKIVTRLTPVLKAAGGMLGRAFGLGLVTLGAYVIWENRDKIIAAVRKIIEEAKDLFESMTGDFGARDLVIDAANDVADADTSNTPSPNAPQSTGPAGPRNKLPSLAAAQRSRSRGKVEITLNQPIYLDGKKVGHSVLKHAIDAAAHA